MVRSVQLYGIGISDDIIDFLQQEIDAHEAPDESHRSPYQTTLLAPNLKQTPETQSDIIVEFIAAPEAFREDRNLHSVQIRLFFHILPTIEISHLIVGLLRLRMEISPFNAEGITTALHEAILNGLIHGNLGMQSDDINTMENLQQFYDRAQQKLRHSKYSRLPITVELCLNEFMLTVSIEDKGKGFTPKISADDTPLHGKGISMIRYFADDIMWLLGGRKINMRFDLAGPRSQASATSNRNHRSDIPAQARILIVDDSEMQWVLIQEILRSRGFRQFEFAHNGEEGIFKTYSFQPDIVILDLMMPKIDGFRYCRRIRKDKQFRDMPIIVQTILSQPYQRTEAFEAGATDLVIKPLNLLELVARTMLHLEQRHMLKELRHYQLQMRKELDDARNMQRAILPDMHHISSIEKKYGFTVRSHFQPSLAIGGDFWSIRSLSPHHLGFYMVDFSGHGVTAALNTFRLHALMQKTTLEAPGIQLRDLNRTLRSLLQRGQYATMFLGIFDTKEDTLTYASAAAPPVIHIAGKRISLLGSTGCMLGADDNVQYETRKIFFPLGDALILYSDALIETEDNRGVMMSEDKLLHAVREQALGGAEHVFQHLKTLFNDTYSSNLKDDLTLNLCARKYQAS